MKAIALLLLIALSTPVFAAPVPRTVSVNPTSLRTMLVKSNFGVLQQLNQVHQAKDQVLIARGNLLPRLNLGAAITGLTSGPAFALSAVSFLLPFLLPSNWANLHQSEYLLEAQKVGYRLVQLNNYASAYTLFSTMLSDLAIREVLISEQNDLVTVRDWLVKQRKYVGNVAQEDVDRADAEVRLATANVSAMDELLVRERAALREMLALDLSANIVLEPLHTPASAAEALDVFQLTKKIQAVAPENMQIAYLDKAAQEARWAKTFGFLSGANLNVGSGGSVSFSNLSGGAQFSIGFDYVPGIQLANDSIASIRLRARELLAQQQQLAEATLGSIAEAKKQVEEATAAEAQLLSVFRAEFRRYTLGLTDLLHVLDAQKTVARATAVKVKAQADLDALRITLHRELLSAEFAAIPGCRIRAEAERKDRDWLSKIFRPRDFQISIDEACAPAN